METKNYDEAAQDKLWSIINGYSSPQALRCAVELGFADIIHKHGKPIILKELASQIPKKTVDIDRLHRLMRYLVQMELFFAQQVDGEFRYGLQPMAKFLVKGGEMCMNPLILTYTSSDYLSTWSYVKDSLETDFSADKIFRDGYCDFLAKDKERMKDFNEAMACDSRLVISALLRHSEDVFDKIGSLVDVGGGTGTLARAIARALPHIQCSPYDLPNVIADAPHYPLLMLLITQRWLEWEETCSGPSPMLMPFC